MRCPCHTRSEKALAFLCIMDWVVRPRAYAPLHVASGARAALKQGEADGHKVPVSMSSLSTQHRCRLKGAIHAGREVV